MTLFTTESLPKAVADLLRLNNYEVSESVHVNGAEIDIIAKSLSDPFANTIYIEATAEYVNNTNYGKDATKFLLVKEKDASCVCISLSSVGFTAEVIERAVASRIKDATGETSYLRIFAVRRL